MQPTETTNTEPRKLDRRRSFGRVTPPWQRGDFDRPAQYEQDGAFFDSHDREIVPGQPLKQVVPDVGVEADRALPTADAPSAAEAPSAAAPAPVAGAAELSADELIAGVDTLPWDVFKSNARRILGKDCPSGKKLILAALTDLRAPKGAAARPAAAAAARPAKGNAAPQIDLAAWARGTRQYLFSEVQKAIDTTYSRAVTRRDDAVWFLVDQGLIEAAEAKPDL